MSEEHLIFAQLAALIRLRFLHLDNQFARSEDIGRGLGDSGAGRDVVFIGGADTVARGGLDQDLMTVMHQLGNTRRREAGAIFVVFGLSWGRRSAWR